MEGISDDDKLSLLKLVLFLPTVLVCVLVALVFLLKTSAHRKRSLLLPPSPRGLPLIGHLHLLGSNPHTSLCALSRIHGPLMFLRFGSVPVVVASTPPMARQILQAHDRIFAFRFQPAVPTHMYNCQDILFSQLGPYLKLLRQICLTDLFGPKRLLSFQPLIAEEVHALLRSILATDAGPMPVPVPVRAKLYAATCNIISRMAIGKRLEDLATRSQADPSYNLVNLLLEVIRLLGVFNIGDFIPCLAWMDLQGCVRKTKVLRQKLWTVWQEVIDARRQMRRQGGKDTASEEHDFLDVLLAAAFESRPNVDVPITDANIMAVLTDMFGAGIDTSSISTEWALAELLANPITMKKLQGELEQVVGMSHLVQETDIPRLPYLCAVVKETMRLHPVLPLLVPHKASQECNISGYDIPAGTLAYVNVWAIGRDPTIWERAVEFRPERFLESNTDVRGQHFELLPFGSGRRACPGLALGLSNVQYMLASIVHSFEWSSSGKLNMSEKFGIVMALEEPLAATATPRLARHLYE